MFEFWRETTAGSVPGLLGQSGRRRPENVSILSSQIGAAAPPASRLRETPGKREFVPRDQVSSLLVVYCSLFLHINLQFFIHKNCFELFLSAHFLF